MKRAAMFAALMLLFVHGCKSAAVVGSDCPASGCMPLVSMPTAGATSSQQQPAMSDDAEDAWDGECEDLDCDAGVLDQSDAQCDGDCED